MRLKIFQGERLSTEVAYDLIGIQDLHYHLAWPLVEGVQGDMDLPLGHWGLTSPTHLFASPEGMF